MGKSRKTPSKISPSYTVTPHNAQTKIGEGKMSPAEYLNCSASYLQHCFKTQLSLLNRDSIFQRFGINRQEMQCLLQLSGFLENINKPLVSRGIFVDYISGSYGTKAKYYGYTKGLIEKGCLGSFEYISHPDSISLGITDYGIEVMRVFFEDQDKLFRRYNREAECKIISIVQGESIPKYNARQQTA